MGTGGVDSKSTAQYYLNNSHITKATRAEEVFKFTNINPLFDPSKMKLPRESCDSADSPRSRGIILAEDVTGSMSTYILNLIQEQFPKLIEEIHKSVSFNPHIMFMGVGDADGHWGPDDPNGDEAPLQVTQFEADLRMLQQLQEIWIENGGKGNGYEGYCLPWYFAGKHIKMDCFNKRGEKGFLFTFGNDGPTPRVNKDKINKVFGNNSSIEADYVTGKECLDMASKMFNCYHIVIGASDCWEYDERYRKWKNLMGSHVCILNDHHYVSELVITILRMYEGESKTAALRKIESGMARRVVSEALKNHEETVEISSSHKKFNGNTIEVF